MSQRATSAIAHMGIDIGKAAFHVVGLDAGAGVARVRMQHRAFLDVAASANGDRLVVSTHHGTGPDAHVVGKRGAARRGR